MGMITAKHSWSDQDTTKYKLGVFKAEMIWKIYEGKSIFLTEHIL